MNWAQVCLICCGSGAATPPATHPHRPRETQKGRIEAREIEINKHKSDWTSQYPPLKDRIPDGPSLNREWEGGGGNGREEGGTGGGKPATCPGSRAGGSVAAQGWSTLNWGDGSVEEPGLREQDPQEQELREQELREQELREQELREQELREQGLREKELREQELQEQELQEQGL